MSELPIHTVLPELLAALRDGPNAVLVAPPGAGKTTAVAPALLGEPWCDGEILLLSPRRVAARAAAERMAELLGERAGETIGYATRLDTKRSAKTRVTVMTEAIFVNRIVDDPELPGVAGVLFDEAHERHLDSDLGLALALESQVVLRPDLRLLVMSATIDGARFASLLGDAPAIESEGRSFPLRIEWLGSDPSQRIEEAMGGAIARAWRAEEGDILAFLPGVREIERVRERVEMRLKDALVLPLHGQVEPAAQRAAIRRDPDGRRRIVLATAIAETSLTLDGVSVVVDSGLARRAMFDRAAGTTHLETVRASQAASAQRAGRAARQGPGIAYRVWEEAGHAGRPTFDAPEIETSDLAPMVLDLARWGSVDASALQWLDAPPAAALEAARKQLAELGALDAEGRITSLGERIAQLPLDPPMAAAVLHGAEMGCPEDVARLALLAQERGLGGRGEDLAARLARWNGERGGRAEASRKLAARWAALAKRLVEPTQAGSPALALAHGLADRVAKRRDPSGEHWLSAGGRGYVLDPASPLARAEWLVVCNAQGQAKGARITAALALEPVDVEQGLAHRIETRRILRWNEKEGRIEARVERRFGAIVIASGPDEAPDPKAMVDMLVEKAVERLGTLLPPDLLARAKFAGVDALSDQALVEQADLWLAPLLHGRRDLKVGAGRYAEAALSLLDWDTRQRLDRLAPRAFSSPAGTSHSIDYTGEDAPSVEVRVQALFGLERHPMIGDTPLLLKLTSPAGRPIQATRDLAGFWRGSWADVRKDMKGRYPKHRWPDEPWAEKPSLKTKNAFSKTGE
ncbi:ATP-dependent helicase HrpB [Erythrobacter sp. LQ02-29]|uniref:ATP-dependent helicase HrpB n=1 Tax=Erythrobacter sp. LQ02-29 TaxID=2920384 RepID=UPI001F4EF973|nr:ATP-dependent helicase HrpB [Erythrobacter sp. LQ02-29]MCP9223668.1 ATP-dependent helicase HrpB [Erythrobacter sp. LQ02-29]